MGIKSPVGRVSYPNLFKARKIDEKPDSVPRWSVTLVFDDPSWVPYREFKAAVAQIVKDHYGLTDSLEDILQGKFKGTKRLSPKFHWPFRPAEDKLLDSGEYRPGFPEGSEFISFARIEDFGPPSHCGPDGTTPLGPRDVYGGMWGRVFTNPRCYKHPAGGVGVSCYLEAFQKVRDDEPIGAAPVEASDVFDSVDDSADYAPREDDGDEIPF